MNAPHRTTTVVVAAVIVEQQRVLMTRRPAGSHLAGCWEFPGGKVEPDEDPRQALARELREELGIDVDVGDIVDVTFYRYADWSIMLLFYEGRRRDPDAAPQCLGVNALAWCTDAELDTLDLPPPDVTVLSKVRRRMRRNA